VASEVPEISNEVRQRTDPPRHQRPGPHRSEHGRAATGVRVLGRRNRIRFDAQVRAFLRCNCNHDEPVATAERVDERPDASSNTAAPGGSVHIDLSELRSLLYVIAALGALLLLVSTATLAVVIQRSTRGREAR
jgi:hypothetical protein